MLFNGGSLIPLDLDGQDGGRRAYWLGAIKLRGAYTPWVAVYGRSRARVVRALEAYGARGLGGRGNALYTGVDRAFQVARVSLAEARRIAGKARV